MLLVRSPLLASCPGMNFFVRVCNNEMLDISSEVTAFGPRTPRALNTSMCWNPSLKIPLQAADVRFEDNNKWSGEWGLTSLQNAPQSRMCDWNLNVEKDNNIDWVEKENKFWQVSPCVRDNLCLTSNPGVAFVLVVVKICQSPISLNKTTLVRAVRVIP